MKLIDHAGGRPGARATRDAGYGGAVRYLANSPERGMPNKILLPEEAREFLDLGMALVSNWQKGKDKTADWKRGHQGGVLDARLAEEHHLKCGGDRTAPIFFSIDEDLSLDAWNRLAAPYLKGAADVIGVDRVGAYGGLNTMHWAEEDQVVGTAGDGKLWLWQTRAWSRRNGLLTWHRATVLRQEIVCPPDFAQVAGITVDVNTTQADDFGQWFHVRGAAAAVAAGATPQLDTVLEQMIGAGQ